MSIHYYLSLTPEALIASMLPPDKFGTYLAVGTKNQSRGEAIFFSLGDLQDTPFDFADAEKRCVPHADGRPKNSVYVAIYRVLERIPLNAIHNLYMVTPDGRVLELQPTATLPDFDHNYHLYQEISPVHPRVASILTPKSFTRYMTDPENAIQVPKICFVDLRLDELASDPENGRTNDLPYYHIDHLRDCLMQLREIPQSKQTKIVERIQPAVFPYRMIEHGIFLGSIDKMLYYPFPTKQELNSKYYEWWRSASIISEKEDNI